MAIREIAEKVASDNLGCRDFNQFSAAAKQLILLTRGDDPKSLHLPADCFIRNLSSNLGSSEAIKQAAQLLSESKPLPGSSEDYLHVIGHQVLSNYHLGTHTHSVQVYSFLCLLHNLIKDQGASGLSNFGSEERRVIQFLAGNMTEERWHKVKFAGVIHDVCKGAFFLAFWLETGAFNESQIRLVPFHTSLFLPLAEMFAVDPEITALAVLHHYLIKNYPGVDIVHLFDNLLLDDVFCFMVEAINFADCYSALRARRPEYRQLGSEAFSHDQAFAILREIVRQKGVGSWVLKCIEPLKNSGWLDLIFMEKMSLAACTI
jgi:hypothetical protein